jgi:hypothetical protein
MALWRGDVGIWMERHHFCKHPAPRCQDFPAAPPSSSGKNSTPAHRIPGPSVFLDPLGWDSAPAHVLEFSPCNPGAAAPWPEVAPPSRGRNPAAVTLPPPTQTCIQSPHCHQDFVLLRWWQNQSQATPPPRGQSCPSHPGAGISIPFPAVLVPHFFPTRRPWAKSYSQRPPPHRGKNSS